MNKWEFTGKVNYLKKVNGFISMRILNVFEITCLCPSVIKTLFIHQGDDVHAEGHFEMFIKPKKHKVMLIVDKINKV